MQCIEHHYYMKNLRGVISSLVAGAVALAMVSTVAAQTTTGKAKVIKMKGQARFTTGNGVWQPLKVGDVLKPGTVIQTAMEKGSYVDLVLGEGAGGTVVEVGGGASAAASPVANYQSKGQQNL